MAVTQIGGPMWMQTASTMAIPEETRAADENCPAVHSERVLPFIKRQELVPSKEKRPFENNIGRKELKSIVLDIKSEKRPH